MLVFCAAVLIILGLFRTAFTRPAYTSSNVTTPTRDVCAGCHSGTAAAGGSAVVNFPSGLTYTPGVVQHLSVKIADPTHTRGGYLLTARMANSGYRRQQRRLYEGHDPRHGRGQLCNLDLEL